MAESSAIKSKLKLLLKDDKLVKIYIDKFGEVINITNIKKVKADNAELTDLPPLALDPSETELNNGSKNKKAVGDDPIYENLVTCPICNNTTVKSYNLKAKSQIIEDTPLLIHHYRGISKYRKVNFNLLQTIVCPQCLFASPDPKDFTKVNSITERITKSQLLVQTNLLTAIRESKNSREEILGKPVESYNDFLRPRDENTAITAIRLSIARAKLEVEFDFPFSYFKVGSYYLKIADIQKSMGKDNLESIKEAARMFEAAVTESNCPKLEVELEALYLAIVTNIVIDQKNEAAGYIKLFKDLKTEFEEKLKENPRSMDLKKDFSSVDKWEKRAQTAWSYRDEEHYWREI